MRRFAGCLVVSLLASAAAWVGCRDDLGEETLPLLPGSGTDAGMGGDAYGGGSGVPDAIVAIDDAAVPGDGSGEGGIPDAGSGEGGPGSDATVIVDAGSGEGGPGSDAGLGGDAYGGGGTDDGGGVTPDDGGGGRPDARRGLGLDPSDRTSFYACAGGPASAGIEVGLPIALALAIAVRRRRRWHQAGAPDRAP